MRKRKRNHTAVPAGSKVQDPYLPFLSNTTPGVQILYENFRLRRTIADALDVLENKAAFSASDNARIEIGPLPLPGAGTTWMPHVVFQTETQRSVALLPASPKFIAIRDGATDLEEFETSRLQDATVYFDSRVVLLDGTILRRVEFLPEMLGRKPSDLDHFVVDALIWYNNAQDWCYRYIADDLPANMRDFVSREPFIDLLRLRELKVPLPKQLAGFIRDMRSDVSISEQKIRDALKKYGLRIPKSRPRRCQTAS